MLAQITGDDLEQYFASGGAGYSWDVILQLLAEQGLPVDASWTPADVAAYFGIAPPGAQPTAAPATVAPSVNVVASAPPAAVAQGGTMTVNGYTSNDATAAMHADPSDPWFHYYWPLPGEIPDVSWYPYDDRNNPSIYVEANQPGTVQRHPLPGTQITIGGVTLYGAGAGPTAPQAGTVAAATAGLIPPAVVASSPALNPPPPPAPPPAPSTTTPGAAAPPAANVAPAAAPMLPTPPPVSPYPQYLINVSSPVQFTAPANTLPPGTIMVLLGGKQRPASSIDDAVTVLNNGGGVARADGSEAVIQHVQYNGADVDLGEGSPYLVDSNPLNVVFGQGWFPGQLDFVTSLVAAGISIPPTLAVAPNAGAGGGIDLGGGVSFSLDPVTLGLIGVGLYLFFGRKKG